MDRKRQGEIAELAFMHKAASLGFGVAKPYGDSARYDFIVEDAGKLTRVQVKSTSQLFQGGYFLNAQRRLNWGTLSYTADEVDVVVAYVVPEEAWYVIPIEAIGGKKSLRVYPHRPEKDKKYGKYREKWELLRRKRAGTVARIHASEETGFYDPSVQPPAPLTSSVRLRP